MKKYVVAGDDMAVGKALFDKGIPLNVIGSFGLHAPTANIMTALIREKTPFDTLDRKTMKNIPVLSAFPAEKRKTILGGVV